MPEVSKRQAAREAANFSMAPSGLWTPQRTTAAANRVVSTYRRTPEDLLQVGASFYPNWRQDAEHIGQQIGQSHEAGAALLAHLSPQNEAESNRVQAMQLVHGLSDKAAAAMVKAGQHSIDAVGAKSRADAAAKAGNTREHGYWSTEYAKHRIEHNKWRAQSGITGTPLGM